jgi:serine/threonine protein kinase
MQNNWLEGKQLSNFRVDEFLGRGGMAQVYKGWDLTLERPVAIKVIAAPFQDDPVYIARFLQEGRSMARWRHENIVHVYFAGQENDISYLVMEYIEGIDLKAWLARYKKNNQKIPKEEVQRIGNAIAEALDYAHDHHIIHRDVKPSNILMADDGRILLTDFGLAIDTQEGSSGEAFGSPKYISPEQAQSSKDVVPQSDLYSLGVILYEMLTGSAPFDGGSPTATAVQHMNQAPPLPSVLNPGLNKETEDVLLRALKKSPDNRYQDGRTLMAALNDALNSGGEPVGPRTFSIKPVADVVAAHIASPGREKIENPDDSLAGSPVPPVDRQQLRKILPVAGIGAGVLFLCIVGILLVTLIFGRIGENGALFGESANGTAVASNAESGNNGGGSSQQGTNGNNEGSSQEQAPAPTVTLPGGNSGSTENRLIFFYNSGGFYAWNPGGRDITIRQLAFQQVDNGGIPTGSFFEARRWAGYYPAIQVGKCDRLEILNDVPKERPGQCQGYNAIMTPEENDPMVFWLGGENSNQFIVTYGGQEIGRCDSAAGQCEVVIP